MSAFREATAAFTNASAQGRIDAERALNAVLAVPATNLSQSVVKLALFASFYDISDCGCDASSFGIIVAELARFAACEALTGAAGVA